MITWSLGRQELSQSKDDSLLIILYHLNTLKYISPSDFIRTLSLPRTYLEILLCLMPDDFTRWRETRWSEGVKKLSPLNISLYLP